MIQKFLPCIAGLLQQTPFIGKEHLNSASFLKTKHALDFIWIIDRSWRMNVTIVEMGSNFANQLFLFDHSHYN